jgi:hypothetical protein
MSTPKQTISELLKNSVEIKVKNGNTKGLFTFYQNNDTGSLQLLVKESQLNKEYIYFSQIADGINDIGVERGYYYASYIFYIKKYFDKLQFIKPNTSFYFDENSKLSKSSDANISDAVLTSSSILAEDKEEEEIRYLINFDNLILSEIFTEIKDAEIENDSKQFYLGDFNKDKSTIESIQTFPENTNIKTKYVFYNPKVKFYGSTEIADSRNVSIKVFHTFMSLPDNDYEPRMNDQRVGYYVTKTNDMTTTTTVNYRDFIHRWRLIKKDPTADLSEPVTPITWWIENSTPLEWRETIKEGVLAWNAAFEKAGFKNAIEVYVQPDGADWNAGDVRYNVLRWASSPTPQYVGYGPSVVNPKTGEIIGADIMLEFQMFRSTNHQNDLYVNENVNDKSHKSCKCSAMKHANEGLQFGNAVLDVTGVSEYELTRLQKEYMKWVVMHEIGHTLGLRHNMKASQLFTPEQLADKDFIKGKSLSGSVMDYMAINLTNDPSKQGQYYSTNIGPYDIWAIQCGYTPFNNESERLALLNKSTLPELAFGTDEDDMGNPGKAIDPRIMTFDLSSDAITYSVNRIKLVNKLMKNIKNKFLINGETYQGLVNAYNRLQVEKTRAGKVISRYIGGVYTERALVGQQGATKPFTPVPLKEQKRAMRALDKYIFSPEAIEIQTNFYNYLANQRRESDFYEKTEDPKIHTTMLAGQLNILEHIIHPNTLQRMLDSELYGNRYKLVTFMNDLNDIMFKEDINGKINSFRRNLQFYYVKNTLIKMVTEISSRSSTSRSIAYYNLNKIKSWLSKYKDSGDLASRAHKKYLKTLISNALKKI